MSKVIIPLFFIFFITNYLYAQNEYYLTLRSDKVNLRQGPSFEYPVKLTYEKKFLPVLIIDKSYNFRKIIDHENNSGWIHISQLSKKKAAISNKTEVIIYKKSSKYSKPLALVEKGRLFLIKKCENSWCKIETGDYSGWVKKEHLKGRL
jgi:SH3-like domain-containing protein|tara:strand:- start:44 stop:490 length:447 start_codon:yes stop_codon:yes gene_type:complete